MKKLTLLLVTLLITTATWANGVEIDGIYYILAGDSASVTYTGSNSYSGNTYSGIISIPSEVTYNQQVYYVTSIGDYAFRGCSTLTSVIIPQSVQRIGNYAFRDCSSINSITCSAIIPPALGTDILRYVTTTPLLFVLSQSASLYQNTEQWRDLKIRRCSFIENNIRILESFVDVQRVPTDSALLILTANAPKNCTFEMWSDSITDNPRKISNKQNIELSAIYTIDTTQIPSPANMQTLGTSFWVTLSLTNAPRGITYVEPFIAIAATNACTVTISNPNTGWSHIPLYVQANSWTVVKDIPIGQWYDLSWTATNCGEKVDNKGLLVEATADVSVYAAMRMEYSYDASNILPITAIQSEYILQDYPPYNSEGDAHATFAIVANEDNTLVDITPSTPTIGGKPADTTFTVALNKGQSYQVVGTDQQTFSGTRVKARNCKKIAVFSGADFTQVPGGKSARDCLYEQAIPINYWGTEFVITRSLEKDANRVRITAKEDSTCILIDNAFIALINSGETYEFEISENLAPTIKDIQTKAGREIPDIYNGEAHFIQTSCPVAVFSYDVSSEYRFNEITRIGDPSMVWISPLQQRISKITFGACGTSGPTGHTDRHFVNIVCLTSDINNINLSSDQRASIALNFSPVPGNTKYSYARVFLVDTDTGTDKVYTITSRRGVVAHVYGSGHNESYAYSVGGHKSLFAHISDNCNLNGKDEDIHSLPIDSTTLHTLIITSQDCTKSNTFTVSNGQNVELIAYEDAHNHFIQWSDGNTDNPRAVFVTQDTSFVAIYVKDTFRITTNANFIERGMTFGDTVSIYGETIGISAQANYGYHFTQWNDGNTNNPRTIVAQESKHYVAIFEKNQYQVSVTKDANISSIEGEGVYDYLNVATLTANMNYAYSFDHWSDGSTDNPRTLTITQDTTLFAFSAPITNGLCGDNLIWNYTDGILVISGTGAMYDYSTDSMPWIAFQDSITNIVINNGCTSIGNFAFYGLSNKNLKTIDLPNSIVSIGQFAFANCEYIKNLYLGTNVEKISVSAFAGDERLYYITCYAEEPPLLDDSAFENYDVYLYVPCSAQDEYKVAKGWKKFNKENVTCIGAGDATVSKDEVTVDPEETNATFTWPNNAQAASYSLQITKDSVVFCTLIFNSLGQLTGIAFAPSRDGSRQISAAVQVANAWKFTVTGLNSASAYAFYMDVKNSDNQTIKSYAGTFQTKGDVVTDLEDRLIDSPTDRFTKIIKDNSLLILRDGKTYNAQGAEL